MAFVDLYREGLTFLLSNEDFIVQEALLCSSERYVKTAMAAVDFSWSKAAFVMSASNVERLTGDSVAAQYSTSRYVAVSAVYPSESLSTQNLYNIEIGFFYHYLHILQHRDKQTRFNH